MTRTANLKLKMTRKSAKLLHLQKLKQKGLGVNEVEEYAAKEIWRGGGRSLRYREERRKEVVRVLMKGKIGSAKVEEEEARRRFRCSAEYL